MGTWAAGVENSKSCCTTNNILSSLIVAQASYQINSAVQAQRGQLSLQNSVSVAFTPRKDFLPSHLPLLTWGFQCLRTFDAKHWATECIYATSFIPSRELRRSHLWAPLPTLQYWRSKILSKTLCLKSSRGDIYAKTPKVPKPTFLTSLPNWKMFPISTITVSTHSFRHT